MDLSNFSYSHIYWIFLLPLVGAGADIITGWVMAPILAWMIKYNQETIN